MESKNNALSKEDKTKILQRVKHNMKCENLESSEQDIKNGQDILDGKKTGDQVIAEEKARMKAEGIIKWNIAFNNKITKEQKEKIIKQIKHSYQCEKMPLDDLDVKDLEALLEDKNSGDQLVKEQIERMKKEGIIKSNVALNKKTNLTVEEQEKAQQQIIHNMECENMPASSQDTQNIQDILSGNKTVEQVVSEEEARMRKEGLIK